MAESRRSWYARGLVFVSVAALIAAGCTGGDEGDVAAPSSSSAPPKTLQLVDAGTSGQQDADDNAADDDAADDDAADDIVAPTPTASSEPEPTPRSVEPGPAPNDPSAAGLTNANEAPLDSESDPQPSDAIVASPTPSSEAATPTSVSSNAGSENAVVERAEAIPSGDAVHSPATPQADGPAVLAPPTVGEGSVLAAVVLGDPVQIEPGQGEEGEDANASPDTAPTTEPNDQQDAPPPPVSDPAPTTTTTTTTPSPESDPSAPTSTTTSTTSTLPPTPEAPADGSANGGAEEPEEEPPPPVTFSDGTTLADDRPTPEPLELEDDLTESADWQLYEQIIPFRPECYVDQAATATIEDVDGVSALRLTANAIGDLRSNHAMLGQFVSSSPVPFGPQQVRVKAMSPATSVGQMQTGPELSIQITARTDAGEYLTAIFGVQHVPITGVWHVLTGGSVQGAWSAAATAPLQPDTWYEIILDFNTATNTYDQLTIAGPETVAVSFTDVSTVWEQKGMTTEATWVTLSVENLFTCDAPFPTTAEIFYRDLSVTSLPG